MWSFGITILELALGAFPYAPAGAPRLVFWDLLHHIVENPAPNPPTHFSQQFQGFISACLQKEPAVR
jgi:serine/threonine protein kinase